MSDEAQRWLAYAQENREVAAITGLPMPRD